MRRTSTIFSFALALAVTLVACDTTVNPFLDDLEPPLHVVDGFLDGNADLQQVRVQRLRRRSDLPTATLGEFSVTSIAEPSGVTTVWRDSLITLDDGSMGHLFSAPLTPLPGIRYRLRVSDSTGTTEVSTTVPSVPGSFYFPPDFFPTVTQLTILRDVGDRPPELALRYEVTEPEDSSRHIFTYEYLSPGRPRVSGWEFTLFLGSDRRRIGATLGRADNDTLLILNSVSIVFELPSSEWQQLTSNGRPSGFFASIGSYSLDVPVNQETRSIMKVQ